MPEKNKKTFVRFAKTLPWIFVIAGIVGLIASSMLVYDNNKIAANPNYIPSCNLNPILSCGSVIKAPEAKAFSIPNPYVGLVAFPILLTTGMAMFAGAKFKRWYWLGLEAGAIFGIGFIHWLFYESVYRIHALCPYCMVVWAIIIPTFWYVTLYNLQTGVIALPKKYKPVTDFLVNHHLDILVLWFLIIAGLILKHFWYYYGHYL
jgi:uncharacterized membrane protein